MASLNGIGNKPRAKGSIEERMIDRDVFLFDPEDEGLAVHTLNSGTAVVWLLCDGTRDVEEIATEIASTYRLPQEQVMADVRDAVARYHELGLLET